MKRKKKILTAALCLLLIGCMHKERTEPIEPEYVFTYAENQAEDYPTTKGAYCFAELVKERTKGKIRIQIKPGAILGDEKSVVEQMRFGGVDFARVSTSSLGELAPMLNVLQMPYLYTGAEHMWKVLDGAMGEQFMQSLEGTGLIGLSWYDAGARSFYTSKNPVRTPEDFRGLTIRVQESRLMSRVVESLGAKAVQLPYSDVYSALQTGLIDGAENNWPSYESERHYEVARYMTLDEHSRLPEMQIISQITWDQLSEEYQNIIRECALESAEYERILWKERSEESREKVQKMGCQVTMLEPNELRKFQDAMLPVYNEFCGEYMDLIDWIVAVGR